MHECYNGNHRGATTTDHWTERPTPKKRVITASEIHDAPKSKGHSDDTGTLATSEATTTILLDPSLHTL